MLPANSFPKYCRGNLTELSEYADELSENFDDKETEDGLTSLQKVLKFSAGVTFNCFYTVKDPTNFNNQGKDLSRTTILFNILYNLGFMYTDIVKASEIINDEYTGSTDEWEKLGFYIGDFIMRFFWSRYVPRNYRR